MKNNKGKFTSSDLSSIIESALRLGVEIDEEEALQWLMAMSSHQYDDDIIFDQRAGVFGHKVTMLDFSDKEDVVNMCSFFSQRFKHN